ncbi:MAG: DUF4136 domain-containing protein [Flavobacteriaceae bacterium]|nr:DUF4136 domain-containing protein [Flavobacteriaceae bacterium]
MFRVCLYLLLITSISCNSIQVITHVNEKADFGKFHSFKTVNDLERPGNKDAYNQYLELDRAIAEKMKERKYTEKADADLGVHYRIILSKKTEVDIDRNRPYVYNSNRAFLRKYTEGVLIVEMRDRKAKKVVWQASLDLRINRKKTLDQAINDTIRYIFNEYPFEAGSNEMKFPQKEAK